MKNKKEIIVRKEITVRLNPDIAHKLIEFQGHYLIKEQKRLSQSAVVNKALAYFMEHTYAAWDKPSRQRELDGIDGAEPQTD